MGSIHFTKGVAAEGGGVELQGRAKGKHSPPNKRTGGA